MIKTVILNSILLLLCSCASLHSKQKLVKRGYAFVESKRYLNQFKDVRFSGSEFFNLSLSKDTLKAISKNEIKQRLSNIERLVALMPDSIVHNPNHIDSFYSNPNKIAYIQKHKLITKNIHF